MHIQCKDCKHNMQNGDCHYGFRWASGGGGQAVYDTCEVYFCKDYSEHDKESWEGESDGE